MTPQAVFWYHYEFFGGKIIFCLFLRIDTFDSGMCLSYFYRLQPKGNHYETNRRQIPNQAMPLAQNYVAVVLKLFQGLHFLTFVREAGSHGVVVRVTCRTAFLPQTPDAHPPFAVT
jgi:hypothetical protein